MYEYKCIITNIVDGDTVDVNIDLGFNVYLNNRRVRLSSIDAPETRTKDLVEKALGFASKERLSQLMPIGSTFIVATVLDKNDSFGRILGTFYKTKSDRSINETMIAEGHAVPYK
jgi:micrococcal nuclease